MALTMKPCNPTPIRALVLCALLILHCASDTRGLLQLGDYSPSYTGSVTGTYSIGDYSLSYSTQSFMSTYSTPRPDPPPVVDPYLSFGAGISSDIVELTVTPLEIPNATAGIVPQSLLEYVPHDPTTRFVKSPTFGPFFMGSGRTIPPAEAAISVIKPDICSCKVHCWSALWCVAVSGVKMSNGSVTCFFTDHLATIKVEMDELATYIVFIDRMTEKMDMHTISGTNEIYMLPKTPQDLPTADIFCHNLPGFRLAVFITKPEIDTAFMFLEKIGADVNVGIIRGENAELDAWNDGTLFDDSYLHYYHDLLSRQASGTLATEPQYRLKISDKKIGDVNLVPFTSICQGYLF